MTRPRDPICGIAWPIVFDAVPQVAMLTVGGVQAVTGLLVTGASGFLGRAAIAAFARNGYASVPRCVGSPSQLYPRALKSCSIRICRKTFDWRPLLDGVDQVVHLAGIAHTGRRATPELYDRINRLATAKLAAAAAQAGVEHFVFVSSIRAQSGPAADHALTEQ